MPLTIINIILLLLVLLLLSDLGLYKRVIIGAELIEIITLINI